MSFFSYGFVNMTAIWSKVFIGTIKTVFISDVSLEMMVYVVSESTSRSILLDPLYILVLEKRVFLPSFSFFRVYENYVLFSSFYSLYLEYEYGVFQTL